jgi:hypothetical protein
MQSRFDHHPDTSADSRGRERGDSWVAGERGKIDGQRQKERKYRWESEESEERDA